MVSKPLFRREITIITLAYPIRTHYSGPMSLQWRHNERDAVSNHRRFDGLLNSWFRRRSKKTSKFGVTGLCEGDSPVNGESPSQRAGNAENVSIWWRHHVTSWYWNGPLIGRPRRRNAVVCGGLFHWITFWYFTTGCHVREWYFVWMKI